MFVNFDKVIIERLPEHVDCYKLTAETDGVTVVYPRVCFTISGGNLNIMVMQDDGVIYELREITI